MANSWSLQEDSIWGNDQVDDNWCWGSWGLLSLYHFRCMYITDFLIGALRDPIQFINICTVTGFYTHCAYIYIYIYKVQWVYNSELTAKKQIQTNQWEKLTKLRKLDKAVQCVKLQIQDHSNKVLVSKDFNRSTVLSMSSNVC